MLSRTAIDVPRGMLEFSELANLRVPNPALFVEVENEQILERNWAIFRGHEGVAKHGAEARLTGGRLTQPICQIDHARVQV